MDYILVNKEQRRKINKITNNNIRLEWNNPSLLNTLMGELSEIKSYNCDDDIRNMVSCLIKKYSSYNVFDTNKEDFFNDIKKDVDEIKNISLNWFGLNLYTLEEELRIHEFCMIKGPGGIGKSYFIKCLEEKLTEKRIPHLCIYGKFIKDFSNIEFDVISQVALKEGFVFIFDAMNEISEDMQYQLLNEIRLLQSLNKKIRFIITYRTNTISNEILNEFNKIARITLNFSGVSYESALVELMKKPVPDIYKYENILFSNNALILNMLCEILNDNKITNEEIDNLVSITFIYEQYFKKGIDKVFRNTKLIKAPVDFWADTKKIAKWMYSNNSKQIDLNNLIDLINGYEVYIDVLSQAGFLEKYEYDSKIYFYFSMDSLSDFLIARSIFDELRGKSEKEQIDLISFKAKSMYEVGEALILAIFDFYKSDYKLIKKIMTATGLIGRFNYETILKINFNTDQISEFIKEFRPSKTSELINVFGGFTDKPFNCVNYLNQYYKEQKLQTIELSHCLSGKYLENVKGRLKNILYFITLNNNCDTRIEEAFYFAMWCCASPNHDVRLLSTKLLYEITINHIEYKDKIISAYSNIMDYYIKESIIQVLAKYYSKDEKIINFFYLLMNSDMTLSAKSIRRISEYIGDGNGYINWNRKNLLLENSNYIISDELNDILFRIDLMDKNFMPFRYRGRDSIDIHYKFMNESKEIIKSVNKVVNEEFKCVENGECNGVIRFERYLSKKIDIKYNDDLIDANSFLYSLEKIFAEIFEFYDRKINDDKDRILREGDFYHSLFLKCIDISVGLLYGSLMCNYYLNEFATFNNASNTIGYEVYDPLEYGEDVNIISPIPVFRQEIEILDNKIIDQIVIPEHKNSEWAKDIKITKDNLLNILKPIKYKNYDWILLGGRISIKQSGEHGYLWEDTYDIWCCTSSYETIIDDGSARYLTIELNEYSNCLKEYASTVEKPWLCKRIKELKYDFELLDDTNLVFPPSDLIKYFNLRYSNTNTSWNDAEDNQVIICNNNKSSYYKDFATSTLFIRKDYFEEYVKNKTLKYFCFTERYIDGIGYSDETSVHFEIENNVIVKQIYNYKNYNNETRPKCDNCPFGILKEKKDAINNSMIEYMSFLKELEYTSDDN